MTIRDVLSALNPETKFSATGTIAWTYNDYAGTYLFGREPITTEIPEAAFSDDLSQAYATIARKCSEIEKLKAELEKLEKERKNYCYKIQEAEQKSDMYRNLAVGLVRTLKENKEKNKRMKILQHGVVIEFECEVCGCKWQMGAQEAKENAQDLVEYEWCDCPDCDQKDVKGKFKKLGG